MIHQGNIKEIRGREVEPADVVIGGSPCQGFSTAGKQFGLADDRSATIAEQIRIVKEMRDADAADGRADYLVRPRYMVWENVPGAFNSNKGEDFRCVLEETARIAEPGAVIPRPADGKWRNAGAVMGNGWSIAWRVLDAQFWGVPQRRRRIALVADFGGYSAPEILFERQSLSGDTESGGEAGEGTAGGSKMGAGKADKGVGYIAPVFAKCLRAKANLSFREDSDNIIVQAAGFNGKAGSKSGGIAYHEETSPTLKAGQDTHVMDMGFNGQNSVTAAGVELREETAPVLRTSVVPAVCIAGNTMDRQPDGNGVGYQNDISYTLNTRDRHAVVYDTRGNGSGAVCPTLTGDHENRVTDYTAVCIATGQANAETLTERSPMLNCNHEQPIVFRYSFARRLTPLECERLQGYPDDWTVLQKITDMTDEEYAFFSWVWPLDKSMKQGRPMDEIKPPKKEKLIRWHNKLDSDSARYKALGNSIAIPPWKWICKRISAMYERDATMASLFDGIGGFPYIWEQINGKGSCVWSSEVEPFPMAVTWYRFNGKE